MVFFEAPDPTVSVEAEGWTCSTGSVGAASFSETGQTVVPTVMTLVTTIGVRVAGQSVTAASQLVMVLVIVERMVEVVMAGGALELAFRLTLELGMALGTNSKLGDTMFDWIGSLVEGAAEALLTGGREALPLATARWRRTRACPPRCGRWYPWGMLASDTAANAAMVVRMVERCMVT